MLKSSAKIIVAAMALSGCGQSSIGIGDLDTNDSGKLEGAPPDESSTAESTCPEIYAQCKAGVDGTCGQFESKCRDGEGYCPGLFRTCKNQDNTEACGKWEIECRDGAAAAPEQPAEPEEPTDPAAGFCADVAQGCGNANASDCEKYKQECSPSALCADVAGGCASGHAEACETFKRECV